MDEKVRVRFAPSPTGYLHIGGARTALFNYLFARKNRGVFILRIEDTDVARSSKELSDVIIEDLRWLGMDFDEGPIYQSERLEIYRSVANKLVDEGKAYRCFCDKEELEKKRILAKEKGIPYKYDGRCRNLSETEIRENLKKGKPFAIRFKVPREGFTRYKDIVQKKIEVKNSELEDFVLLRSDGYPTYHLSCVVDDSEMRITHVIRGADHISNTPKQILLYRTLEKNIPKFAHIPLILGPDRTRLSKRHGATAVSKYREEGYLPEAFAYFLALMGWSPGTNKKILTMDEMIELFDLKDVVKTNAMFDLKKLEWINGQFISKLPSERLFKDVIGVLKKYEIYDPRFENEKKDWFLRCIDLLKVRYRNLDDFGVLGRAYFTDDFNYSDDAIEKYLKGRGDLVEPLLELEKRYEAESELNIKNSEEILREIVEKYGVKSGDFIGALRVILTGQGVAPGIFDVIEILGKDRVLNRILKGVDFLKENG